jgi:hypothetical protein
MEQISFQNCQLLKPSLFWHPHCLPQSAWVEHVPFAFWLSATHKPNSIVELGSHFGLSYFAFCQAVQNLQLPTKCYAIDTWQGDPHAGYYGDDVFEYVKKYSHNLHYTGWAGDIFFRQAKITVLIFFITYLLNLPAHICTRHGRHILLC